MNKYKLDKEDETSVLEIDNVKVRNEQIASLQHIRATRDTDAVNAALAALTHAAQHNENLLAAAVNAARVRATLGGSPTHWKPLLTAIWFPASASPA